MDYYRRKEIIESNGKKHYEFRKIESSELEEIPKNKFISLVDRICGFGERPYDSIEQIHSRLQKLSQFKFSVWSNLIANDLSDGYDIVGDCHTFTGEISYEVKTKEYKKPFQSSTKYIAYDLVLKGITKTETVTQESFSSKEFELIDSSLIEKTTIIN